MKTSFYLSIVLAAGLVFSGCSEKPDEVISEDPVLTPASDTVKVSAEGGNCELGYTLENSVAGGRIEVSHEGDWISDLNCDVLGTVTFTVAANETRDAREGSLTVEYIIPDAEPLSFTVAVVQEGADADVVFKAAFFEGDYYGTALSEAHNYFVTVSDLGLDESGMLKSNATYYQFDIYGEAPADPSSPCIPDGTYTLSEPGMVNSGTFSRDVSCVLSITEDGEYVGPYMFTEGTFTIAKNGDSYDVRVELTTDDGLFHVLEYSGPISLRDLSPKDVWSTLTGDYEADLSGDYRGTAYYYGDFYSMGSCNWMVNIEPVSGTGDAIQLEINTSSMDFYEGIPTGTYSASAAGEALTFVPGYMENLNMFATWWFYYESGMIGSGYSPLTAGEITVVNNGDGTYKFDFFCFDDSPDYNLFTATWSGELELEGYYEGSATSRPVSKLNRLK